MRSQTEAHARVRYAGRALGYAPAYIDTAAIGLDVVSIVVAGLLSTVLYTAVSGVGVDAKPFLGASLLLAVAFTVLMRSRSLYEVGQLLSFDRQIRWVFASWFAAFAFLIVLAYLLKSSGDLSRGGGLVFAASGFVLLGGNRVLWRYWLRRALGRGLLNKRPVALVTLAGSGVTAAQLGAIRRNGYEMAHHVSLADTDGAAGLSAALGSVVAAVRGSAVQEIMVVLPSGQLHLLPAIVDGLHLLPLPIKLLPDANLSRITLQASRQLGPFALVDVKRQPLGRVELALKRALDVAVSAAALFALAPLMVAAMAAVKLDSTGPVLFRQTRRGFNGRTFKILKFRTMTCMEDGAQIVQARRVDARVTRVGRWLRRTSIDELPQLWNVLRGEMSVVGPRPHAVAHDNHYDTLIENYAFRHHVKPGLTGWAQVRGYRGETPNVAAMAARVEHDTWYINNWTILLDVRILVLTCFKLFAKTAY